MFLISDVLFFNLFVRGLSDVLHGFPSTVNILIVTSNSVLRHIVSVHIDLLL